MMDEMRADGSVALTCVGAFLAILIKSSAIPQMVQTLGTSWTSVLTLWPSPR